MALEAKAPGDNRADAGESKGFWPRAWVIATAVAAICAAIGGVVGVVHLLPNDSAATAAYESKVVAYCQNMHALNDSYSGAAIDQANGNYIKARLVSDVHQAVESGQGLTSSLAAITPPSSLAGELAAALKAWNADAQATISFAGYLQSHLPAEFTDQQLQTAVATGFPNERPLGSTVNSAFTDLAGQSSQPLA